MATSVSGSDCRGCLRIAADAVMGQEILEGTGAALEEMRYVARQPIMDAKGVAHGYELLFRAGRTQAFTGDGNAATRDVIDQTITSGLEKLTGGLPVFINCTHEALMDRLVLALPPERTILELLETLEPNSSLLQVCSEYKRAGYRLALDDFAWTPQWEPFVTLADYIKVDLTTSTPAERKVLIARMKGSKAKLVAERVETQEDFAMVYAEGFTLFQGFYFCKPVLLENRRIPENHLVHLVLLAALHDDPLDVSRMSDLVKRDPSLTYKVLRMVNSPLYGTRKEITSIRGALVLVGDEMFRRIATLAILCQMKSIQSQELLRMSFVRGRFCELAAELTGSSAAEQYLLGLLSLFPAILRVPMEKIANTLPLRDEVREALLGLDNRERAVLEWLMCFERGQWKCCDEHSARLGLRPSLLPIVYTKAVAWAEENLKLLS